jgi:hypothetical protein
MKAINLKELYAQASRWALPFLVIALILSMWNGCQKQVIVGDLTNVVDSLAKQTETLTNRNGVLVAQNKAQEVASAKQLEDYTRQIFALNKRDEKRVKEVQQYVQVIQEYKAKDKLAQWTDVSDTNVGDTPKVSDNNVAHLPQPVDTNLIRVPRGFAYGDSTIAFWGKVIRAGVRVDSVKVTNKVHLRMVENGYGFLKLRREQEVQVINTNPAFITTGVTSLKVKDRVSWWHRWGKPVAFGILTFIASDQIRKL